MGIAPVIAPIISLVVIVGLFTLCCYCCRCCCFSQQDSHYHTGKHLHSKLNCPFTSVCFPMYEGLCLFQQEGLCKVLYINKIFCGNISDDFIWDDNLTFATGGCSDMMVHRKHTCVWFFMVYVWLSTQLLCMNCRIGASQAGHCANDCAIPQMDVELQTGVLALIAVGRP